MERIRISVTQVAAAVIFSVFISLAFLANAGIAAAAGPTLDGSTIPKWINQLVIPPVYDPQVVIDSDGRVSHNLTVDVSQFSQQVLPPPMLPTTVWGYGGMVQSPGGSVYFQNAPGATFEATRDIPVNVTWENNLGTLPHLFAVDPTLHWADPNNMVMPMPPFTAFPPGYPLAQSPVPVVPHLHGGEVRSDSDGNPEAWFTATGETGPAYLTNVYHYPNTQLPTTLWYHDHALGITRINVMSGLAGFYLLRDPADTVAPYLPGGDYEVPLVIQDRLFNSDGSMFFPSDGMTMEDHPYWTSMFIGDTIMVNGSVWPNLDVDRRQYRFRMLNGSNSRFYRLALSNGQSFTQIGSDGGYLPAAADLTSLVLAPGERADILIDFSGLQAGAKVIMTNDASTPFPTGVAPDPNTTGQIMQFTAKAGTPVPPVSLPSSLNDIPALTPSAPARTMSLDENINPSGHVNGILLNGQKWSAAIEELPEAGSTEDWKIANVTADTHPIHLHLAQFQVVSRQPYDSLSYYYDWIALNGNPPINHPAIKLDVTPYLQGSPQPPAPNETGWKDTVRANPFEVTTIRVRWAPQDADPALAVPGRNLFSFDPDFGPGYVWHCHILDHEDNEMMRPLKVSTCAKPEPVFSAGAFWGSYAEYVLRELSVRYRVTNQGSAGAINMRMVAGTANSGVIPVSSLPLIFGDIGAAGSPAGNSATAVLKYRVPAGVGTFRVFNTLNTEDTCGNTLYFTDIARN